MSFVKTGVTRGRFMILHWGLSLVCLHSVYLTISDIIVCDSISLTSLVCLHPVFLTISDIIVHDRISLTSLYLHTGSDQIQLQTRLPCSCMNMTQHQRDRIFCHTSMVDMATILVAQSNCICSQSSKKSL